VTTLFRRHAFVAAGAALLAACAKPQTAMFSSRPDVNFRRPGQWSQQNGAWIFSIS
jgi:hypothetical protein